MRRVVIILAGILVSAALGAVAIAATSSGGSSAVTLAHASFFEDYQLSSDAAVAATVAWNAQKLVHGMAGSTLDVREQDAHGGWGPTTQLGPVAQYSVPQLAESPSGAAVVVVTDVEGDLQAPPHGATVVEAVTRSSPSADWSAPVTLWTGANADGATATVGIDAAGVATVAWADYGARPAIWTANVDCATATATGVTRLVAPGRGGVDLHLAVNPAGDALLNWEAETPALAGEAQRVHAAELAAYRTPAGSWSSPHLLGRFTFSNAIGSEFWAPRSPPVALTATGDAAVAWISGFGNSPGAPLRIASFDAATRRWGAAHLLAQTPNGFGVAATGDAGFVSVWSTGPHAALMTAASPNGVRWSRTAPVPGYRHPSDLVDYLASDPMGDVTLALTGPHSQVVYLTRTAAGTWTAPRSAGAGVAPEVTLDSGSTTLLWDQVRRPEDRLEARTIR